MRRIRDVLRLKFGQGLSERQVAASLGLSKTSIGTYLQRARQAGLTWPLPEGLDDDSLELWLFPAAPIVPDPERPVPDWIRIDRELRRPGVTRMLLWEEYRATHPAGFGYTWFCTHFDAWKGRVRPTMRQTHVGGEKVFVDFAGDMIDVVDPGSGEVQPMKLFVAAMGASNYTYAEAVASEGLEDWIGAHVRLFAFLGGVPKMPEAAYAFARWKRARVALDYHVEVDSSWYSVPFGLIREEVDVRVSGDVVEIFHKGQRVASHLRCPGRRSHVTLPDHMPSSHRRHAEWTPARMLAQAAKLGPSVIAFCEAVMADRPHPEQGFRTCLGVLALAKSYDATRLDAACRRGLTIRARSVASISSILKNGLDRAFIEDRPEDRPLKHTNIRGQGYYH